MKIQVVKEKEIDGLFYFNVTVSDSDTHTEHHVSVSHKYWRELTGERVDARALVSDTFEFLLEREPKEAILSSFNISLVQKYFPEYEIKMKEEYATHGPST